MSETDALIEKLCGQSAPVKPLAPPSYWAARLLAVLAAYLVAAQFFLGLRVDFSAQLMRPFFVGEIALLALMATSSAIAAVYALYPDGYQHKDQLRLPFLFLGILIILLCIQMFLPHDPRMVIPMGEGAHGMECSLCIASVAALPAAILFALLRRGACVRPLVSGMLAVLAAASIGCLTLRLAEANDSLSHLVTWHYVPTLLFSALGALAGKYALKW